MEGFNYNAPQYVDFSSPSALELSEYGDEYFDMDHEEKFVNHEESSDPLEIIMIHDTPEAALETIMIPDSPEAADPLELQEAGKPKLRRSISANQILVNTKEQDEASGLSTALQALQLSEKKMVLPSKCNLPETRRKFKSISDLNRPLKLKPKAVSRDAINKIGMQKSDQLKRKMSAENLHPNKYISIAEAINKFQFGTPKRYHSKPSNLQFNSLKSTALACTIPQSPQLSTKQRSRAPNCISRQEQEDLEAEEMKKHQIKANSVNYKILKGPVTNVAVEKKHVTIPQPFKFAEIPFHKPVQVPKAEIYEFHARPAPKTTAPILKNTRRSAMPGPSTTPTYMRRYRETLPKFQEITKNNSSSVKTVELHHDGVPPKKVSKTPVRTKTEPFSFEQRDKLMQQRKEEKIKKFLEEEKKAREFHARPIPAKIAGGSGQVESKVAKLVHDGFGSNTSLHKNDENVEPSPNLFKARPATVIHKKPFIPKKEDRPLLEITEFSLNTDKRAKEREEFEKKIKEKEDESEKRKQETSEMLKQLELEEFNRIRKETVHKANPIKHYKTVDIHPSTKKVTSPISPMITKKRTSRMEN